MQTPEQTLLDLKYLLMEAKQKCVFLSAGPGRERELNRGHGRRRLPVAHGRAGTYADCNGSLACRVPPFLLSIEDPNLDASGKPVGCTNCGGTPSPLPLRPQRVVTETDTCGNGVLQVSVIRSGTAPSWRRTSGGRWRVSVAVATAVAADGDAYSGTGLPVAILYLQVSWRGNCANGPFFD